MYQLNVELTIFLQVIEKELIDIMKIIVIEKFAMIWY